MSARVLLLGGRSLYKQLVHHNDFFNSNFYSKLIASMPPDAPPDPDLPEPIFSMRVPDLPTVCIPFPDGLPPCLTFAELEELLGVDGGAEALIDALLDSPI